LTEILDVLSGLAIVPGQRKDPILMSVCLLPSRSLFLHIPKTGGTWVEYLLPRLGIETSVPETVPGVTYRHSPQPMLSREYPFVFTFVRHPLSWYESWWKFQAGTWTVFEPGVWHPQRCLECCRSDDFSEFIRLCIEHEPGYVTRMYEWYIGPEGYEYVDCIGRHETLQSDLLEVLTQLGYSVDPALMQMEPVNVSPSARGKPVWDPELRRRILELEAPAIRRFYSDSRPLVRSGFHASDDCPQAVDANGSGRKEFRAEAPHSRPLEQPFADGLLGFSRGPAVEPFVEVERERLLDEAQVDQPGGGEQVENPPATQVGRVSLVSRALHFFVLAGLLGVGIGLVIAQNQDSTRTKQVGLPPDEAQRIDNVMKNMARDRSFKGRQSIDHRVKE
jgi:hypothetical protein